MESCIYIIFTIFNLFMIFCMNNNSRQTEIWIIRIIKLKHFIYRQVTFFCNRLNLGSHRNHIACSVLITFTVAASRKNND